MPVAYFLIGIQGSGKSTWARANAGRLQAVVVASDEVRNELEAQGFDATDQSDRVFEIVEERLKELIREGNNVVVDATHSRVRWREKEVAIARQGGARTIAVWFDVPLAVCLARNDQKPGGPRWGDRVVPRDFLLWVAEGFEKPMVGEFDEVWRLAANGSRM